MVTCSSIKHPGNLRKGARFYRSVAANVYIPASDLAVRAKRHISQPGKLPPVKIGVE